MGAPAETKLAEASNVGGTRNVLDLMKELGIKKVRGEASIAENSRLPHARELAAGYAALKQCQSRVCYKPRSSA